VVLLRQIEVSMSQGKPASVACREAGTSQQNYYRSRKEFGGLELHQAKRMKDLERECPAEQVSLVVVFSLSERLKPPSAQWIYDLTSPHGVVQLATTKFYD
jgi:hypothetical protein